MKKIIWALQVALYLLRNWEQVKAVLEDARTTLRSFNHEVSADLVDDLIQNFRLESD
jgi:hypothetical protein